MAWGGIKNLPPGFDVFGGKQESTTIVDRAIQGKVQGLSPNRESLFHDLKRNLLHRDYARYFESCLACANALGEIEGGRYVPEALKDIIEPGLTTAVEQMESIRSDAEQSRTTGRKMQYDPQPSLAQLHTNARRLATAYPDAVGARELDERYRSISESVRAIVPP